MSGQVPTSRRWLWTSRAVVLTFMAAAGVTLLLAQARQARPRLAHALPEVYTCPARPIALDETPPVEATKPAAKAVKGKRDTGPRPKTAPTTAGQKLDAVALARLIDREIQLRLDAENVKASPQSDDAEFLRRAYLDLTGVVPTADKAAAFLDSKEPDKRARLVEELLADARYGRWMAENWANHLVPRESNNRRLLDEPLRKWLTDSLNANKPWDALVYELVTASGTQDANGAVTFFIGNPTPDKVTDTVTRLFLGVQLQCAQCHNHPFTGWKQDEYWAMAAFFMKVRSGNPNAAAKKGISPGVFEAEVGRGKKNGLPESAKIVPAKFLQGEQPKLNAKEPYRPVLGKWLTSPQNPFFARAMVNKLWAHFHGRGLVNPVDDMHEDNAASHPELLDALTEQFKANGFDVKYLVRAMVLSQAYQRTSRPAGNAEVEAELFSRQAVRVLSPEQLYDSLTLVLGSPPAQAGRGKKAANPKKGPANPREGFLTFFRIDEGADPLEYQAGIPQALRLMNAGQFNATGPVVAAAVKAGDNQPTRVIERLYLTALTRRPNEAELQRLTQYVGRQPAPQGAYNDILWAILNSSEFALNH